MDKYVSGRQRKLQVGLSSYSENDTVIQTIGKVGIGTTNATSTLTVFGDSLITGVTTSGEFVGGGKDLRNISGTHLVSYASHSETSNSALSIGGVSGYNQVGILTGTYAVNFNDEFGNSVAISADGNTFIVGAVYDEVPGSGSGTGVVYVYDRVGSGNYFSQVGILTGTYSVDGLDQFGHSVAITADGKTIVVGAYTDELPGSLNSTGVVYVFDRVGDTFNQVGAFSGSGSASTDDNFGFYVAISADGKTIVTSATRDEISGTGDYGVSYVFDRSGNNFNQVGILTGTYAINDLDYFGYSLAINSDGNTIIVGAAYDEFPGSSSGSGVVYVYDRVGDIFNQVGILTGSLSSNNNDYFGYSVATSADGKTIVVGAYDDELNGIDTATGIVYVFDRLGNNFTQVGILTGSHSTNLNDAFGNSVATSADGNTIVVSALYDEIPGFDGTGVSYVYKRQGNSFSQVGILTGTYAVDSGDRFGTSVAISGDGNTIIVGSEGDEFPGSSTESGIAYVFDEVQNTYLYSSPSGNIGIGTDNPQAKLHSYGIDDTLNTVLGAPTNTLIEVKDGNPWSIAFRRTDLGPTADVAAWIDDHRNFIIGNGLPNGGFDYSVGLHTEYVKL